MSRNSSPIGWVVALYHGLACVALVALGPSLAFASDWVPDAVQLHLGAGIQRAPDASARVVVEDEWAAGTTLGVLLDTPVGLGLGVDLEQGRHGRDLFAGAASSELERGTMLVRLRYAWTAPLPVPELLVRPYATAAVGVSRSELTLEMGGDAFAQRLGHAEAHGAGGLEVQYLVEMLRVGLFVDAGYRHRPALRFDKLEGPEGVEAIDAGTLSLSGAEVRVGVSMAIRFGMSSER